ncbi:MAG: hypothetical protein ACK5CE_10720 [Actinomycetes bacterium]|jgi:hypothetical protein
MGRNGHRAIRGVLRGVLLSSIVVVAASCGGSDDGAAGAVSTDVGPVATTSGEPSTAVPGPSALAGVAHDVRRDPG